MLQSSNMLNEMSKKKNRTDKRRKFLNEKIKLKETVTKIFGAGEWSEMSEIKNILVIVAFFLRCKRWLTLYYLVIKYGNIYRRKTC